MIKLIQSDCRWLEIIFYLICRKIFSINEKVDDVIDFIKGYRWTNMFDCDILINTIRKDKILLDSSFIPCQQEFVTALNNPESRIRLEPRSVMELTRGTEFKYTRKHRFHAEMREEINKTEIYPRLKGTKVHAAIYSFLLALRYIADIIKKIKF